MPGSKLSSKGRVTIPKTFRNALGLHTGDRLSFRVRNDGTILMNVERVSVNSLRGAAHSRVKGVTVDAMNQVVRRRGGRG
jgi:AbrB family looped-hinge helix DNA binding protein